jgi:sterol-4alpha-carboxylate 3-dehydrogenase (decarboxylating)
LGSSLSPQLPVQALTTRNRPGDRQAIPGIIKVFHAGQTAFQIGNNLNLFDWVHVDNVVHAHILAAKRLDSPPLDVASFTDRLPLSNASITLRTIPTSERTDVSHLPPPPLSNVDSPLPATRNRFHQFHAATPATVGVAGEAFIITNGEPIPFWTFIRAVWYAYNKHVPPFVVPLPMGLGMAAAGVAESWEWMMGREGGDEGLSRNHVRYVGCHMWFNIEKVILFILMVRRFRLMENDRRGGCWGMNPSLDCRPGLSTLSRSVLHHINTSMY